MEAGSEMTLLVVCCVDVGWSCIGGWVSVCKMVLRVGVIPNKLSYTVSGNCWRYLLTEVISVQ